MKTRTLFIVWTAFLLFMMGISYLISRPVSNAAGVNAGSSKPYIVKVITTYEKCGHTIITEETQQEKPENGVIERTADNYCPHHYLLKEYQGKLAIYSLAHLDEPPIRIIYTEVKSLPETDREMLKTGIELHSEQALQSAIEDYTS